MLRPARSGSTDHERGAGLRLQDRIIKTIFPQLAQAVLDDRRQRAGANEEPTEAELDEVFQATRSLLLRSLHALYAESRGLLAGDSPSASPSTVSFATEQLRHNWNESTGTRCLIDYASLDVRCLGSIYEKLLDGKLRIVRSKPLRSGKPRRPPLGICLTKDNPRRKSTGSYYTPPAIVEYLVANTIGPVLDQKLHALRRDFRKADQQKSAQRLFDLRVIDPAMGCGHFLVEAVEFIAGRLHDFLNEFPNHPVRLLLERAKQKNREAFAARGATADPAGLSDRRLLKQQVLERCIYGVDLDPTAVELAKAILRLDCGLPATLPEQLERHLRCGNALVGDQFPGVLPDDKNSANRSYVTFDCVLGNPPYVRIQNLDDALVAYLQRNYVTAAGKFDLYIPFLERGVGLLRENGRLGMIVPNKFLTADYGAALRGFLAEKRLLRHVVDFHSEHVFPGANAYCCLVFLGAGETAGVAVSRGSLGPPIARDTAVVPATRFGRAPWSARAEDDEASPGGGVPLKTACRAIFQGLITGADRLLIGKREGDTIRLGGDVVEFDAKIFRPVLKGPDVRRFGLRFSRQYVLYPYRIAEGRTELLPEDELADCHPAVYRYLEKHRRELEARGSAAMTYRSWYAHWCPRSIERFQSPKIVTQVLASRASFALDREGDFAFVGGGNAGVYGVIPQGAGEDQLWLLLAVLNSRRFDQQVQSRSSRFGGGYFSYARRFIEEAWVPRMDCLDLSSVPIKRVIALVRRRVDEGPEAGDSLEAEIDAAVDALYLSSHGKNAVSSPPGIEA